MKQSTYTIRENAPLSGRVFIMTLDGDTSAITTPGQFVNIRLPGHAIRRPISVSDWNDHGFRIVYKLAGKGTELMSTFLLGAKLDILTGLGNGFNTKKSGHQPLLIGGGVGAAPLLGLCRRMLDEGKQPHVILGFNSREDILLAKEFQQLGITPDIATADGSFGTKGFVTDLIDLHEYSYFYVCGPSLMFPSIEQRVKTSGQYSYEARMGCGFGACMSCSCKTSFGSKRICKDGPVFEREEIIWETSR